MFAPPRRGSTFFRRLAVAGQVVCPAQAGVYPSPAWSPGWSARFAPPRRGSTSSTSYARHGGGVCPAQAGVYPTSICSRPCSSGLPRPGGGLPSWVPDRTLLVRFAPPRRGSTVRHAGHSWHGGVCPAQAGVYRHRRLANVHIQRLPRPGGGLPVVLTMTATEPEFAPPRRGSTGLGGSDQVLGGVCPAQAGVYPPILASSSCRSRLPRPGGGLPIRAMAPDQWSGFAPPRRGSTPTGQKAS